MKKKEAFKVIQDKKVPPAGRGPGSTGFSKFPFDSMSVGSYFTPPHYQTAALGNRRSKTLKRPERFGMRKVNGEIRCYRIK